VIPALAPRCLHDLDHGLTQRDGCSLIATRSRLEFSIRIQSPSRRVRIHPGFWNSLDSQPSSRRDLTIWRRHSMPKEVQLKRALGGPHGIS
jgi:hypothetical protein